MAAAAPVINIHQWGAGLPDAPQDMAGPDTEQNPWNFGGDHAAELPPDVDLDLDGDVEIWESRSMVADRVRKRRINEMNSAVVPGGIRIENVSVANDVETGEV